MNADRALACDTHGRCFSSRRPPGAGRPGKRGPCGIVPGARPPPAFEHAAPGGSWTRGWHLGNSGIDRAGVVSKSHLRASEQAEISRLKKQKLRTKDRIARLT